MNAIKLFAILFATIVALINADSAFAKGGGSNFMNSAGYQRALKESRERYQQPVVVRPAPYHRRHWRRHRH